MPPVLKKVNLSVQPAKAGKRKEEVDRSSRAQRRDSGSGGRGGVDTDPRRAEEAPTGSSSGSRSGGTATGGRSGSSGSSTGTGSGKSDGPPSGRTAGSSSGSSSASSQSNSETQDTEPQNGIIGEFERTPYDDALLGFGICSSYPIMIAQVPFRNFYEGNTTNLSAEGFLYDIQNSLQDETIKKANDLVNNYFANNADVEARLISESRKNLGLYDAIVRNLPEIKLSRDQIVDQTGTISIDSQSYNKITNLISTTSADDVVPTRSSSTVEILDIKPTKNRGTISSAIAGQSLLSGNSTRSASVSNVERSRTELTFDIPRTSYGDDDLFNIDDFLLTTSEIDRLAPSTSAAYLAKTALAHQAIRSTFANIYYNTKGTIENISEPTNIYKLKNLTNNYDSLKEAADETSSDRTTVGQDEISDFTNFIDKYEGYRESFGKSASLIASRIADESLDKTPFEDMGSLSPKADTISVFNTEQEDISFVFTDSSGRRLLLEDLDIPRTGEECYSIVEAFGTSKDDLARLTTRLKTTQIALENFSNDKKAWMSNQIALFLLKTMFDEFANFFESSYWCDTSKSEYSAARCVMYYRAAEHAKCHKIVYALTNVFRSTVEDISDEEDMEAIFDGTDDSVTSWNSRNNTGTSRLGDVTEIDFSKGTKVPTADFAKAMFGQTTSFGMFDSIVDKVATQFTSISGTTKSMIRLMSFNNFMFVNKLLPAYVRLEVDQAVAFKNRNIFATDSKCTLKWSKRDAAALADVCRSCIAASSIDDVSFTTYSSVVRSSPSNSQKDVINDMYFTKIRDLITDTLQRYENIKNVISFYHGRVKNQQRAINDVNGSYDAIISAYTAYGDANPADKTASIVSKYGTTESIAEVLQRDIRYKQYLKNTRIRSIAARSKNYRSIVKAVHRDVLTENPAYLAIIGIPYGFFENSRIIARSANDIRNAYRYGVDVIAQDLLDDNSPDATVDYSPAFITEDITRRFNGKNRSSAIVSTLDRVEDTQEVSSTSNPNINVCQINIGEASLETLRRDEVLYDHDFYSQLEQSALESYLEDLYGLYPRYSLYRERIDLTQMPEAQIANVIASTVEVPESSEYTSLPPGQEAQLIRSRLFAAIMMHEFFSTTYMVKELEAGILFDRLHYIVYEERKVPADITQITPRVSS
jgi:hypothetical protein